MRSGVNAVLAWCAYFAAQAVAPSALADTLPEAQAVSRWVPSLAITSGVTLHRTSGRHPSSLIDGEADPIAPTPLRRTDSGDDLNTVPFVGAALELMTPALPIATRPRFFVAAELLPTFGSERLITSDGDPTRIRGPEVGAV